MKILVKLELYTETKLDLTDFGYDENQKWDDLSEDEQNEILDPMRENVYPDVSIRMIDE